MVGSLFEESRVFNIRATAIDSTVCSNFIVAAGFYKAFVIDTTFSDDIKTLKIPHNFVSKLACHPKIPGELAMIAGAQIELYSLDTMRPRKPWLQASGGSKAIADFVWHPHDPFAFATCSSHETIKVWDTRIMNDVVLEIGSSTGATQMKYSALMDHIIVTANNESLSLWDERNPYTVITKFDVASHITCVNWHPKDRHTFMTSSKDEMLRAWDFFSPDGELLPDASGYSRYCPCWRFWFSPDGEEYAVAKSPLALKPEGQLEVYQYPFHENTNPLKNDNSDIFIDLCWNKHPERNSKFVWALRQSKGIIRHAIVFDYSDNREEMSIPIAQTAADEEYDRLVESEHEEILETAPSVKTEAVTENVLSPSHQVNASVPTSPERKSLATTQVTINTSRYTMRSLPSSYDSGPSHISNLISKLRQSPSTSSLKSMAKEAATRSTIGLMTSPIAIPINDFERYMYAPNIHGCDLIYELEMLSECIIEGVTMTETNFPRAAISFTYEHYSGAPKIEYELRYHKDFRHNGRILVKILQKDDCPLSGTEARELLKLMQQLSLKLVGGENGATSTTSIGSSYRNMPTIMTKVICDLRKLVEELHVFPNGDVPDIECTATKPIIIPVHNVEEVVPIESSENSLRHSFSLNFYPSALDDFIPAPRTSGAQFDSSGFLVRFGNFRTAVRKPPPSESKMSINGSITHIIPPLDFRALGLVDDDSDNEQPVPKWRHPKFTETIFSQVPTQKINSGSSLSDEDMIRSEYLPDGENLTEFSDFELDDSCTSADHSTLTTSESSDPHSKHLKDTVSEYESFEDKSGSASESESEHLMDQFSLPGGPSGTASDDEIIFVDVEIPLEGNANLKDLYPLDDFDSESDVCVITETVEQVTNELNDFFSDSDEETKKTKITADDDNLEPIEVLSLEEIAEKSLCYNYQPCYEPRSPEVISEESESEFDSSFVSDLEPLSKTRFSKRQRKPKVCKKVASVLLTAPKSSLFPFGDSVTTPKTFHEYIMRMGPILHEIGSSKFSSSKMLGHNSFGDSPPSSLSKGDESNTSRMLQAPHCASPIQSFSLSSSPTPATIILQRNNPRTRLSSYPSHRQTSSVRIRSGSLTLTDTGSNVKTSSSDALVSTPVEVFDISYYLPVSKRLAKFYRVLGSTGPEREEHIRHNVKVAVDSERSDLIDIWTDVKKYAKAVVKVEFKPKCQCSAKLCPAVIKGKYQSIAKMQCQQLREKREREMKTFLLPWEEGTLNTAFFIERLKAHLYHKDIQTVAAVTCTLGQYCKLPKKRNELNRGPEGLTGFGLMRSSSANTGEVGIAHNGLGSECKTQRSASIAETPELLHEKQVSVETAKMSKLLNCTDCPRSNSIGEATLGRLMTPDLALHATAALYGVQIIGGENPCLIFHSNENRVQESEQPKILVPPIDDDKPFIVGRAFDEFEDARISYGQILSRWGMYKQATEVYKFCPTQQPEPFVERVFCDKCQEPVFGDNLDKCQRCEEPSISCALCQRPCTGLLLTCPRCSHGGHVDHIRRWFREQSACPLGCGCICPF